jgi:hypothetical protein
MFLDANKDIGPIVTVRIPAMPFLEVGDIINIHEDSTGVTETYVIHAMSSTIVPGPGGLAGGTMDLTLRQIRSVLDDYVTYQEFFILSYHTLYDGGSETPLGRFGY